jgi:protein-S-isoprenylcysteine O-methyltransferase Ste14
VNNLRNLYVKAAGKLLQLPFIMAALLFFPAWTFNYWQAWVFLAVFFVCSLAITVYLAIKDPKLLERRMNVGPTAEKEKTQKIIVTIAILFFAATIILPAIDHRLEWSLVPASIVILGDILIALAYLAFYFVFRENTYGASTIQIAEDQRVISTGPYAIVRHPMYSAALILVLGIPLALGSWWGLLMFVPTVAGIIWRLLDEEKFLSKNLAGYTDYQSKVHYRLLPFVW